MTDDRSEIDRLVDRMSLREKVGQLNQRLFGWECVQRIDGRWRLTDTFRSELDRWGGIGAIYGLFRADPWSGRSWADGILPEERAEVSAMVIEAVRAGSAQGLPPLLVEEAPHGHQALGGTILPVPLNLAATWDPELVEEAARAVAAELSASGVHIALVSALDVLRDPRWGRSEECLGESPRLAAEMAAALVRGMQGPDRSALRGPGVGVVLKHFAAQGEATGGRNGQSAAIGFRDLWEIHLPPAEAGVRAGAVGVMAAYNDIDGVPCCANRGLLRGLLREEWAFDGLVMADGHAVDRLEAVTGSLPEAARLALRSGVDLSLWDEAYTQLEAVADDDEATRDAIDAACRRVLGVKHLMGLLGEPDEASRGTREPAIQLETARKRTGELSRELAQRSLVRLDTDSDALPLNLEDARRVLVVGPHADEATALLGDYVPPLPEGQERSVLDALRDRLAPGARLDHVPATSSDLETLAAEADLIIAVLGGTSHRSYEDEFTEVGAIDVRADVGQRRATSGEGVDLADLRPPGDQEALIEAVRRAASAPVAAVVVAGRPHVLTSVLEHADAVIWAGYPGPYGAEAIADALTGGSPITGRLPMTLPAHPGAVPVHHDDRHSPEGVYADATDPVLRPFGFGATNQALKVREPETIRNGEATRLRITVENTGPRSESTVLQVYAHRRDGVTVPRLRELVAFRRATIPPQSTEVYEPAVPSAQRYTVTDTFSPVARRVLP